MQTKAKVTISPREASKKPLIFKSAKLLKTRLNLSSYTSSMNNVVMKTLFSFIHTDRIIIVHNAYFFLCMSLIFASKHYIFL